MKTAPKTKATGSISAGLRVLCVGAIFGASAAAQAQPAPLLDIDDASPRRVLQAAAGAVRSHDVFAYQATVPVRVSNKKEDPFALGIMQPVGGFTGSISASVRLERGAATGGISRVFAEGYQPISVLADTTGAVEDPFAMGMFGGIGSERTTVKESAFRAGNDGARAWQLTQKDRVYLDAGLPEGVGMLHGNAAAVVAPFLSIPRLLDIIADPGAYTLEDHGTEKVEGEQCRRIVATTIPSHPGLVGIYERHDKNEASYRRSLRRVRRSERAERIQARNQAFRRADWGYRPESIPFNDWLTPADRAVLVRLVEECLHDFGTRWELWISVNDGMPRRCIRSTFLLNQGWAEETSGEEFSFYIEHAEDITLSDLRVGAAAGEFDAARFQQAKPRGYTRSAFLDE